VPAGVPFLRSLGATHQVLTAAEPAERVQVNLFLSRDVFRDIAPAMDAACGAVLDTPLGLLLGDFMLSVEQRLQDLTLADAQRLAAATGALIAACTAPSAERIAISQELIDRGRLERVRRTVRAHLHSPELGPDMLCRAVGMSRSSLYRLLEAEGGVRNYIRQQRLLEARAILGDPTNRRSIRDIAEDLCFMDPSSFGRTFRRLFGYSAREAAVAALAGARLPGPRAGAGEPRGMRDFGMALRRI
jgi:AraC-like DNA-binding protein